MDGSPQAPGHGVLDVARSGAGSAVLRAAALSPLRLLLPKNHGHGAWVFASSLGGGLVDGDDVLLRVRVRAGATALVTTQASTKVYRGGARQRIDATVEPGGLLVLLPDPIAPFAGSRLDQATTVTLEGDASVLVVDALTCGRAAHGERWQFAAVRSAITISRDGVTLLHDAIELDPRHGPLPDRLGAYDALATVIAVGPRAPLLAAPPLDASFIAAPSPLAAGGTLVRAAATSAEALHTGTRRVLTHLPAALGDDPFARKW